MNDKIMNTLIKSLQMLMMTSVFCMCSFAFAEDIIELEYGNEALEAYKKLALEKGYIYEVGDDSIVFVENDVLYAKRFGNTTLIIKDLSGQWIRTVEVVVYFVGEEPTPYSHIVLNRPYLSGYPDGTFRPKEILTRVEFACAINELLELNIELKEHSDVWGEYVLEHVIKKGYMQDKQDTLNVTRKEMAWFIYKYSQQMDVLLETNPLDVMDVGGQEDFIFHGLNTKAMTLINNKFMPDQFVLREDMVSVIQYISCRQNNISSIKFDDVDSSNPLFWAIQNAGK